MKLSSISKDNLGTISFAWMLADNKRIYQRARVDQRDIKTATETCAIGGPPKDSPLGEVNQVPHRINSV